MIGADKEHVERGAGPASSKMPYLVQVNAGVSLLLQRPDQRASMFFSC
jgi:hypothetical protein